MAQLKDTTITGSLRVTDTNYSTTSQFQILRVPLTSGGTTYGPGTNKQVLKTNGTSTYWGADEVLQEPTTADAAYEILFSASANNNTVTESTKKTLTLTYNPSTKVLTNGTIILNSDSATAANAAAYDILTLGNNINVSSTTEHSEGKINLYSAGTKAHVIVGKTTTTNDYTHTLPNQTGLLVTVNGIPSNDIGSSTQPVYITSEGVVGTCSSYGGGTLVTLNNTSKAASTASFYAPTTGGTKNTQALVGDGANVEPKWVNISPSITITAGDANNTPKINVTVLGQSGTAQSITTATTSAYGATKLTNSYTSTDESLAVTGKALLAALETLDSSLPSGSATSKTLTGLTITNGKLTAATFSDISIAASQINSVIPVGTGGTGVTSYPALDAELKTVAVALTNDTNPFTLDPGTYYLSDTTYSTSYYPQASLTGTMVIHQIGATKKTATIIDSDKIFYGFGDSTSDTVFTWHRTLQAYDESAIYRFTLKDSSDVNGIQLIKDDQGGKLYLYGKDGHTFWFDSYTNDAPLRLVTMGTDSNYKVWQFTRAGNTVFPGTLSLDGILSVGAQNTTNEGGQINLAAAPDYNNDASLDVYKSFFRVISGGVSRFSLDLTTGSLSLDTALSISNGGTGATSAAAARAALAAAKGGDGGAINLDNILYPSLLYCGGGSATGFSGTIYGGVLSIFNSTGETAGNRGVQLFSLVWDNKIYFRRYGGSWQSWYALFSTADTIPIANGGTGATSATTALSNLGGLATTGGTMTGSLTVTSPAAIILKSPTINYTANPSSNLYNAPIYFQEKNGKAIGQIDTAQYTNGQTTFRILLYNYDTSGNRTFLDGPYIYATRAGVVSYRIPNVSAFRNAIGIFFTSKTVAFSNNVATITFNQNAYLINAYAVATDKLIYFYRSNGQTQYKLIIRHPDTSGSSTTFSGNVTIDLCYFSESAATIT